MPKSLVITKRLTKDSGHKRGKMASLTNVTNRRTSEFYKIQTFFNKLEFNI